MPFKIFFIRFIASYQHFSVCLILELIHAADSLRTQMTWRHRMESFDPVYKTDYVWRCTSQRYGKQIGPSRHSAAGDTRWTR